MSKKKLNDKMNRKIETLTIETVEQQLKTIRQAGNPGTGMRRYKPQNKTESTRYD